MARMKSDPQPRRRVQFWGRLGLSLAAGTLFAWLAWEETDVRIADAGASPKTHSDDANTRERSEGKTQAEPQIDSRETGPSRGQSSAKLIPAMANDRKEPFGEPSPAKQALERRLNSTTEKIAGNLTDNSRRQTVAHSRSPPPE